MVPWPSEHQLPGPDSVMVDRPTCPLPVHRNNDIFEWTTRCMRYGNRTSSLDGSISTGNGGAM